MAQTVLSEMGFDAWVALASADPEAFETRRKQLIDQVIQKASRPEQRHRLRCLQWRIDMERRRARTPMAACLRIYRMMWDSVLGEHGMVETFQNPPPARKPRGSAQVISLHSGRTRPCRTS
ncbi:MAG: DUF3135 domain-containing protein [Gammaproteobacteria bacterium]|nr:DUF3135 domain-containing protein [Gammaproteobacteria bacterium]